MKTEKEAQMQPADYLKMPYGRTVFPEDDGTFRAEIIEFPGCIATGDTAGDALSNLERVADSWLETIISRGQNVPDPIETTPFSGKLMLRMPKSLHKKAAYLAAREGSSLNQYITASIAEKVGSASKRAIEHGWLAFSRSPSATYLINVEFRPASAAKHQTPSGARLLPYMMPVIWASESSNA